MWEQVRENTTGVVQQVREHGIVRSDFAADPNYEPHEERECGVAPKDFESQNDEQASARFHGDQAVANQGETVVAESSDGLEEREPVGIDALAVDEVVGPRGSTKVDP